MTKKKKKMGDAIFKKIMAESFQNWQDSPRIQKIHDVLNRVNENNLHLNHGETAERLSK